MKKTIFTVMALILGSFLMFGSAEAALLSFDLSHPDIFSDTTGNYSYNATTNLFSSDAVAKTISFDGITLVDITGGSYELDFYVDEAGNYQGGV